MRFEFRSRICIERLVECFLQFGDLVLAVRVPSFDLGRGGQDAFDATSPTPPSPSFREAIGIDSAHERQQCVVVHLADRIEFMVMASSASDGQPKESRPDGDHDIVGVVELGSKGIIGLIVPDVESVEARGDDRFAPSFRLVRWTKALGLGPLITGELFDDELVVGFVLDQSVDHVVTVSPGVGF